MGDGGGIGRILLCAHVIILRDHIESHIGDGASRDLESPDLIGHDLKIHIPVGNKLFHIFRKIEFSVCLSISACHCGERAGGLKIPAVKLHGEGSLSIISGKFLLRHREHDGPVLGGDDLVGRCPGLHELS